MAITTETATTTPFTGNGSTVAFAFTFKCFAQDQIAVILDTSGTQVTQTLTTHYTVSLNADQDASPGGTVTMVTAPTSSDELIIVSDVPYTQPTTVSNAGGYYPEVENNARDRIVLQITQLRDLISRALLAPHGDTGGTLSNIDEITSNLTNINLVGADLAGADTIGIVAADLAGDDNIGSVVDNLASIDTIVLNLAALLTVAAGGYNIAALGGDATQAVFYLNTTNSQVSPESGVSWSHYGRNDGVINYWGGGPDGGLGLYAGISIYGKDHASYPQDIKIRSRDTKPAWFKAFTQTPGATLEGTWSFGGYPLVDVDVLETRAISATAAGTRVEIDDDTMRLGHADDTVYNLFHKVDTGYIQYGGGISQGSGFTLRCYAGTTGAATTANGLIAYSENIQVLRYRQDDDEWDFKGADIKGINDITALSTLNGTPVEDIIANKLASYTVAGVPTAAGNTGSMIYVSDETGGAVPAFCDGTNWRRCTDRAVVS